VSVPLVHIGYHKTATSWLRKRLFDRADMGFRLYPRGKVSTLFVKVPLLGFDAARCRQAIDPWLSETQSRGLVPVLSHVRLSGYFASGGFDSQLIADRLAVVLPKAKVLIVVREQRATVMSTYHQYVREGGASTLSAYLDPRQEGSFRVPGFDLAFFAYDRLVAYYVGLFGAANVLVLPYELCSHDPFEFLSRIVEFANAHGTQRVSTLDTSRVNVAPSTLAIAGLRIVNLVFRANPLHPTPIAPSRAASWLGTRVVLGLDGPLTHRLSRGLMARQRARVTRRIGSFYEASNARLRDLTGLDLARYGYALPGSTVTNGTSVVIPDGRSP
jgi:hypothetical protein